LNTQVAPAEKPHEGSRAHQRLTVGPDRRGSRARVQPAVQSPTTSTPGATARANRRAVIEHVVLAVAAHRIAKDREAEVADDADRLNGLADGESEVEVGGVESDPALVAGVRKSREEANRHRGPSRAFPRGTGSSRRSAVLDVAGAEAVIMSMPASGALGLVVLIRQRVAEAAVNLESRRWNSRQC
jgi:hypothetical protein